MNGHDVAAVLALLTTVNGLSAAPGESTSVRPEDSAVRALLERGAERSATFRNLLGKLDNGDVIVYVRVAMCNGGVRACLLWASPDPRMRRLLIKLDRLSGSDDDLTVLLAHELQHASEVVSAPDIYDVRSFRQWLEEHGQRGPHGFETRDATAVSRTVAAELRTYGITARARR